MELDRNQLKVQALLERVSNLTRQYEDQDAERRVDITSLGLQLQEAQEKLKQYEEDADVVPKQAEDADTTSK